MSVDTVYMKCYLDVDSVYIGSGEREHYMKTMRTLITTTLGGILAMTQLAAAQTPNPASDPRIDPQVRSFLAEINKDSSPFWELPQPKPQEILTGLQNRTPVDMSGVTTMEKTITQDGRSVKLYIMKPEQTSAASLASYSSSTAASGSSATSRTINDCCATLWSAPGKSACSSNTPRFPRREFPTQLEESYAALKWVAEHAGEFGADGSRIAIAGNSVGGNMTAALTLMAKDRKRTQDQLPGALHSGDRRQRRYRRPTMNLALAASWRAPS